MRLRLLATALIATAVSACATSTPVCRAPMPDEMSAFRAIISHNPEALAATMAPGMARNELIAGNTELRAHIWGSNGETRGSVVSLLTQPPLCVMSDPAATDPSAREILVYPQSRYDAVLPADPAATPLPYGVSNRDYLRCRFEQTANGWALADACNFQPRYATITG